MNNYYQLSVGDIFFGRHNDKQLFRQTNQCVVTWSFNEQRWSAPINETLNICHCFPSSSGGFIVLVLCYDDDHMLRGSELGIKEGIHQLGFSLRWFVTQTYKSEG